FKNNRYRGTFFNRIVRMSLFGTIGLAFWAGGFVIFYRVLKYFLKAEGFGDILAYKLLSMVLLTFFALLIFSGIVTILSKLYLSRDLVLVHSLPVSRSKIFLARWFESTLDSSWMVIIYSLPVFLSYGIAYQADFIYYSTVVMVLIPMCLIASVVSSLIVMAVAVALPAGRIRTVFVFLGLILFILLIVSFRMMRPERFVNPDAFASLVFYFKSLRTPGSPFLPTTWIYDGIRAALGGTASETLFQLALLWSFSLASIFVLTWIAGTVYFRGFSKAQTTPERLFRTNAKRNRAAFFLLKYFSPPTRAYVVKEIKTFFRDQTQWPQLFLLVALIIVYVYNFSVLPLEKSPIKTIYLQNTISFLNMALAAFVLTAVAARFVFPAVSIESSAFWIVKSSPISIRSFLRIKFFVYFIPLLVLAEILIIVTNILLHVTPFIMVLSVVTIFLMVPGIVAMGVGLGAIYPDFQSENPSQAVTSFGGLLFMILCAVFIGLVVVIEAGPVYSVFMANFRGTALTITAWIRLLVSFSVVLVLCSLAVILPMRFGGHHLEASSSGQ
ncbi:MAG: hypothetical protein JXA41_05805, partial [Deltaproteobacteria bacterium]|nr:hypothetical protein [Deltaproteobacteria bacterium]